MYVGVNAIAPGRRSRTKEAIRAVRHVFLEADHDGPQLLATISSRGDLPPPSYVLHSSANRVHVFWRTTGFTIECVERLQKYLARELDSDPAATPASQLTRFPGLLYLKPPLVVMREIRRCCNNLIVRRCRIVRGRRSMMLLLLSRRQFSRRKAERAPQRTNSAGSTGLRLGSDRHDRKRSAIGR